jgi:putative transposase
VLQRPVESAHYTSDEFQQLLKSQSITCSMSRRGECWDNAAMESFFSTLKTERCARTVYQTKDQARADVFDYIEWFYDPFRKHSKLNYISPIQSEQRQRSKG